MSISLLRSRASRSGTNSGITLIRVIPRPKPSHIFGASFLLRLLRLQLLPFALAVSSNCQQLTTGNLLEATARSHDPDFASTVILLIHYDSEAAIGLILNKKMPVPVSEVLLEAKGQSATVYAGGPIAIGVRGLVRSRSQPFFTVISDKPQLLKMIASGAPPTSFRVYAGYTGWTARQLQSEVARGLWRVLPPNARMLWQRLTLPRPIR
jgi:putative transcriptional regulator